MLIALALGAGVLLSGDVIDVEGIAHFELPVELQTSRLKTQRLSGSWDFVASNLPLYLHLLIADMPHAERNLDIRGLNGDRKPPDASYFKIGKVWASRETIVSAKEFHDRIAFIFNRRYYALDCWDHSILQFKIDPVRDKAMMDALLKSWAWVQPAKGK